MNCWQLDLIWTSPNEIESIGIDINPFWSVIVIVIDLYIVIGSPFLWDLGKFIKMFQRKWENPLLLDFVNLPLFVKDLKSTIAALC